MKRDGNNDDSGNKQVVDEEGNVDAKVKDTIINARNRVDETKYAIDVKAAVDPEVSLSPPEQTQVFAKTVKQFLVRIEPLLRSDEIKGNEKYYKGGGEPLAAFELVPQDTNGYPFSLVTRDRDEQDLRRMIGLPRGVDLPEPVEITIDGLQDVIEMPIVVSHQWDVTVSKGGAPPNWDHEYPQDQQLVPEQVYMNAVREADLFLQDIGIGVETGLPEVDERAEPF